MKNKIYILILLVSILLVFPQCKKQLTETAQSFVSPNNFFQTEAENEAAVNSVYSVLYNFFSNWGFVVLTDASSDLMWANSNTSFDGTFNYTPTAPGIGATVWSSGYKGILYANDAIYGIENSPVADSLKRPMIAEAKFLRSLYYFFLTSTFNDVPYWTFPINTEKRVQDVSTLPRTKASEIRDSLIADLKTCARDLPLKQTGTNTGRATRGAALALEEKIALFNNDWQTAIEAGKQIIQDAQYKLLSNYADIFKTKNTNESIFEIQYSYSTSGVHRSQSLPASFMPAGHKTGTSLYDGVDLGTKVATTYGNTLPTSVLVSLYSDSSDTRKDVVLGNSYNGQSFNRYLNSGMPWAGPKFWDLKMNNIASDNNIIYLRYADVLLMLAEAYNESGDQLNALSYLNMVRQRAHIPDITIENEDSIRQVIRDERGRELAGEYQRRFDLIRWGIFYDAVKKTAIDNPNGIENLEPYRQYYPIPAMEITKNSALTQNPGY